MLRKSMEALPEYSGFAPSDNGAVHHQHEHKISRPGPRLLLGSVAALLLPFKGVIRERNATVTWHVGLHKDALHAS